MPRAPSRLRRIALPLLTWLCLCAGYASAASGTALYFIDAHSQVDHTLRDLELIIQRMDEAGVDRTILAARAGRTPQQIAAFARSHPDRIVAAVRTKSGAYSANHPKYYDKLRAQLGSGQFQAMAEVLMYHARKGDKAPEVVVYPEDARVTFALDEAVERGWPFVIHIEFAALDEDGRQRFMAAMERMLRAHPDHPFALNHMGQLAASEVRRLIENHANIHFLTAHANPGIIRHSGQPWVNLFDGETLAPAWQALLMQHPTRFVFALDNVWDKHWTTFYPEQMRYWRKAMADLPADVAHAVAHGNAERLWKLPPRLDEVGGSSKMRP